MDDVLDIFPNSGFDELWNDSENIDTELFPTPQKRYSPPSPVYDLEEICKEVNVPVPLPNPESPVSTPPRPSLPAPVPVPIPASVPVPISTPVPSPVSVIPSPPTPASPPSQAITMSKPRIISNVKVSPPIYIPTPIAILKRKREERRESRKKIKIMEPEIEFTKPIVFQNYIFVNIAGYHIRVPEYYEKVVRQFKTFVPKGKIVIKWDKSGNMISSRLISRNIGLNKYQRAQKS